jgi:threonine synthase
VAPIYSRMQSLKPGKLSGDGLHRYAAQLPIPRERLVSLGEGSTPLVSIGTLGREFGLRRLMIKDERRNPTGSWRDRFSALAASQHAGADATVGTAGGDAMVTSGEPTERTAAASVFAGPFGDAVTSRTVSVTRVFRGATDRGRTQTR